MARSKQKAPLQRKPSDLVPDEAWKTKANGNGTAADDDHDDSPAGQLKAAISPLTAPETQQQQHQQQSDAGLVELIVCVGGIYGSFLSWAYLQERITSTAYPSPSDTRGEQEKWTYSIVLNTIQSALAAVTGLLYLYFSSARSSSSSSSSRNPVPSPFPSWRILPALLLVACTNSLASPFGYAALAHIDYLTYLLAKSCKLVPVLALHLTIFRRRFPLYKYMVVALVTAGVAIFTLSQKQSGGKKRGGGAANNNSVWGLFLLAINLLFDGLTNSTQDHIFATSSPRYTGPQMMAAQNILGTLLQTAYLTLLPLVPPSLLSAASIPTAATGELASALAFLRAHPSALADVLAFAACGAVGQIFIYATLARFSSLLLVTVTVTRKMLSMILSVVAFGHRLSAPQWLGVLLVFGGVGAEGWISRQEKLAKERAKKGEQRQRQQRQQEGKKDR